MILLIDNYDSFSYNLYQCIGTITTDIKVVRNDELTIEDIESLTPQAIIISPGPGRPSEAGNIEEIIQSFYNKIPILGVCLGHQAICETFGATVTYAKSIMHGKSSVLEIDEEDMIFNGIEDFTVARYHSLAADETTIPKDIKILARCDDGEIMAVKHREYPVYGLQFHPESILTPDGTKMINNFLGGITHD